jgi:hypothetical protein
MPAHKRQRSVLDRTLELVKKHGSVSAAARATDTPASTMQKRYEAAMGKLSPAAPPREVSNLKPLRRHLIIPDTQVRPGVPTDHLDWVGKAIVEYRPDVIVHIGDHWDFPSLNRHEEAGSMPMEGKRYQDDLKAGNDAFLQLCAPMNALKDYAPEKHFLDGNHENRADRAASADPKWFGHIGTGNCNTLDWKRHGFLERIEIDGILYSHYFQNTHSSYPIGGEVANRLTKVGATFVQGHEQGFRFGNRITASGKTLTGIVAGSCYLHVEDYRGAQGQRHWRGLVILNEVDDGEFNLMQLSLRYLCRKYEGVDLHEFMAKKYAYSNWDHLK